MELMAVLQTISHYGDALPFLLNSSDFAYKREVIDHFSRFDHHPVVALFDELSSQPRMLNFMAPPTAMLYVTPGLTPRDDVVWPEAVVARVGGRDRLVTFLHQLRDFAAASDFDSFFCDHVPFYEQLVAGVVPKLGTHDYVAELEAFYGLHHASYNLVLVPLYGPVGFGPLIDTVGEAGTASRHVYNILGPRGVEDGLPDFGETGYFALMQRHEFSHSFINPLTEKHWHLVEGAASRFASLPEQKVCGEWEECINEYAIRAVTTYLAFRDGVAAGEAALAAERARNVVWIDELLACVDEYARNRMRYPTLDDFYPRLLRIFRELPLTPLSAEKGYNRMIYFDIFAEGGELG